MALSGSGIDLSAMSASTAVGFVAQGSTYRPWTLTTLLWRLLRQAEEQYGPRDTAWTIMGIEFGATVPQTWYPNRASGARDVVVILSETAASSLQQAVFQLAHEVVHLLAPGDDPPANRFEEGLATLFSHQICAQCGSTFHAGDARYLSAETDLLALLNLAPPNAISMLRLDRPRFSSFDPTFLMDKIPGLSSDLAMALCELLPDLPAAGQQPAS
jgi:hypothetical protein